MSRPIKFRKWDKDLKRMHVFGEDVRDSIIFDDNQEAYYYSEAFYYSLQNDSARELMQYTGLKDRNGKEIYEGDILAWQDHKHLWSTADDRFTAKATVEFDLVELKYTVGHLSLSAKREFEVIGNIYETPLEDTP
ncbi:YopX family protein [Paenibacillus sp. FSL R7-0340]|uniref:YopX family protein n=1 Tax=Paenibacillus sp. FSL R7-0340 TaxID=2921684 RepID=UPI0030F5754A